MLTWDIRKEDLTKLMDMWREEDPNTVVTMWFYEGGFSTEHSNEYSVGYSQFRWAEKTDDEISEGFNENIKY